MVFLQFKHLTLNADFLTSFLQSQDFPKTTNTITTSKFLTIVCRTLQIQPLCLSPNKPSLSCFLRDILSKQLEK